MYSEHRVIFGARLAYSGLISRAFSPNMAQSFTTRQIAAKVRMNCLVKLLVYLQSFHGSKQGWNIKRPTPIYEKCLSKTLYLCESLNFKKVYNLPLPPPPLNQPTTPTPPPPYPNPQPLDLPLRDGGETSNIQDEGLYADRKAKGLRLSATPHFPSSVLLCQLGVCLKRLSSIQSPRPVAAVVWTINQGLLNGHWPAMLG